MFPLSALVLSTTTALAAPDIAPLVQQCEDKWIAGDYAGSIAACDARLAQDANDVEAMWRKARSIYGQGEMSAASMSSDQRIAMYSKVTKLGEQIIALDPNNGLGHHWQGTGLGRTATARGVLSSLFMADDIETAWLTAVKSDVRYRASNDTSSFPSDTYYALGQFYRLCPDYVIVRMLAGTKGDIDTSITWLRKAVADSPKRGEVLKELGVSLLCKAERDKDTAAGAEGRKWLQKSLALPPAKPTDTIDKAQIPIILQRADDACGYSRDGWQDVSEDSLKKQQ
jgi:hypothetical protein